MRGVRLGGLVAAFALLLSAASTASARSPLRTALADPVEFSGPGAALAFERASRAGVTAARLILFWSDVAPGPVRPAGFDPADHADPGYRWDGFDRQVRLAAANGIEPIVNIFRAPAWATGSGEGPPGTVRPDAAELALFAGAAAARYSGDLPDLPRVRYWQVWNEPNISLFLNPQWVDGRPVSPDLYRAMVNRFAAAVKAVHSDNLVIAGGTAPFRDPSVGGENWGPLSFMRRLFCLSPTLVRTCRNRVVFDVWAHHPYTSGGPEHEAVLPDDVSLGDLPQMRQVLAAGVRARAIVSPRPPEFWVTEFGWDSSPPDPRGVPARLHARWAAEALYRIWRSGVTLATWFRLRDEPLDSSLFQTGLWYRGASLVADRPKPALAAFRFPLVAFPRNRGVYVWGRTPASRRASVLVEQSFRGGWKRLGVLRTDRHGLFEARFRSTPRGFVRARTVDRGERAVPFSLARVPDRYFTPFGQETPLEPGR